MLCLKNDLEICQSFSQMSQQKDCLSMSSIYNLTAVIANQKNILCKINKKVDNCMIVRFTVAAFLSPPKH